MTPYNTPLNRHEIARLLAMVIFRHLRSIHTPQNVHDSTSNCLDDSAKTLLSVTTKVVNTHGEQGDH